MTTTPNTPDLLPCPFCGHPPAEIRGHPSAKRPVQCSNAECFMSRFCIEADKWCSRARPDSTPQSEAVSGCVPAHGSASDTPRTDAELNEQYSLGETHPTGWSFARQLERELNVCRAALGLKDHEQIVLDQAPKFGTILITRGGWERVRVGPVTDQSSATELEWMRMAIQAERQLTQTQNMLNVLKEHIKRIGPELETLVEIARDSQNSELGGAKASTPTEVR